MENKQIVNATRHSSIVVSRKPWEEATNEAHVPPLMMRDSDLSNSSRFADMRSDMTFLHESVQCISDKLKAYLQKRGKV